MNEGKVSTGSQDLDAWLEGCYEKGIISLLYGPAASGKSNCAILVACSEAAERRKQISLDSETILRNIILLNPTNFAEQKKSFINLLVELKRTESISLIIIDSITMLYRLEFADARKEGLEKVQEINSELAKEMRILHEIAVKKNIPVIITGQVYSDFLSEEEWLKGKEAGVNLVGGDILKYWSKAVLELQKKGNKRFGVIRKHRSMPEKIISFEIVNEGIKKKGWF